MVAACVVALILSWVSFSRLETSLVLIAGIFVGLYLANLDKLDTATLTTRTREGISLFQCNRCTGYIVTGGVAAEIAFYLVSTGGLGPVRSWQDICLVLVAGYAMFGDVAWDILQHGGLAHSQTPTSWKVRLRTGIFAGLGTSVIFWGFWSLRILLGK